MINKKRVRSHIKTLQRIKTWQLLILLIITGFLSATFLRLNNIGMIERREAVINADGSSNDDITQNRLYDLQRFVSSHMNTDMGKGVYLEAAYQRDVQAAYANASIDSNVNGNIYKKVQDICIPQFSHWSYAYIQCTTNELAKYPASENLISSIDLPKANAYLHVFYSPLWSADFAGWSVVIFMVILTMIIIRLTSVGLLKLLLRHHYKSI